MSEIKIDAGVDFGAPPAAVEALLQQGVWLYRHDRVAADQRFRDALAFVDLRRGETATAERRLAKLGELSGYADVGGEVVADLARGIAS